MNGIVLRVEYFGPRFCLKKELVDTVDCQCLIVHSDLIKKYHLRFDEHLQFHFYAEEFCIMASEKYNIPSYALSIDSISSPITFCFDHV